MRRSHAARHEARAYLNAAPRLLRTPARQHGVALVTAMLMTALAVSAVTSLFWQQQVQVRMMENQHLHVQTQWVLRAGQDWTRQLLRLDTERSPELTTLDGLWNAPAAEIRLDRCLDRPADDDVAEQATIANRIIDAQSRFNLSNLASARTLNLVEIRIYERLLVVLKLDPALALRTAQWIAASQRGGDASPGRPQAAASRVDELSGIPGYTPQTLAALSDFIVLLPVATDLNLDTASAELLAAVTGLAQAEARQLAERRRQAYFRTLEEFGAALPDRSVLEGARIGLRSDYFLVESRIRIERSALNNVSLIYRPHGGAATTELVWTRQE